MTLVRACAVLALLAPLAAGAEPPAVDLDRARITAHGDTILVRHLPVRTATGLAYEDVTIKLRADGSGTISFVSGPRPVVRASPPPVVQHFRAGTYRSDDGLTYTVEALPPDPKAAVPTPRWSITLIGNGDAPLQSATWFAGRGDTGPLSERLERAEILDNAFSYGLSGGGASEAFREGGLIGAAQASDVLTIVSFHSGCCSERPKPTAVLRLTYSGG